MVLCRCDRASQRSSRVDHRPLNNLLEDTHSRFCIKGRSILSSPRSPKLPLLAPPIFPTTSMSPRQFLLPDLLASCPLKDATNPYYKEASAESRAWINNYDIFTDRKRAFFVQGSNELLCSHVFNYAGHQQFRTTCDFVRLFFYITQFEGAGT
jgi:hypothetical protein